MTNKVILLVGTHHTPAIELISQLRSDSKFSWQIEYIGHQTSSETHLKNTIIPKLKVNFHPLESGRFDRRWLPATLWGLPKIIAAIFNSIRIIKLVKPSLVISFGGYLSVPVVFAAWLKHLPVITHEQTTTISLSTKINSLFATKVALSFPSQKSSPKYITTGNLLRSEIFQTNSPRYQKLNRQLPTQPLLFITGGNQGSAAINRCLLSLIPKLHPSFTIIHQTGNLDFPQYRRLVQKFPNYHPQNYINLEDIGWVLNNAHIIISRAGANACQEIVALRKNAVLIPLPHSQQNEQLKNALWTQEQLPQTIIVGQNQLTPDSLLNAIRRLKTVPSTKIPSHIPNYQLLHLIHETTV